MPDVKCPYCQHEQEINHDDNYGYEEDYEHKHTCGNCGRIFWFTTTLRFFYEVFCFKEEDHKIVKSEIASFYECTKCNYIEVRK